jgi:uncharacterized protein (TIGR02996 family)
MSDEAAFLNAILENPQDDAPRLIYADWLDERGDAIAAQKADFLRITSRLLTAPPGPRRLPLMTRLRQQAIGLDPEWLAVVSKLELEACVSAFEIPCPKKWENLRATRNPKVRWCASCNKSVHFCDSIDAARGLARQGRCVAVNLSVLRQSVDLAPHGRFEPGEMRVVGRIRRTDSPATSDEIASKPSRRERLARRRYKRSDPE